MTSYQWTLAVVMILYVGVMVGISVWAQRRIKSTEDFVVAGRKLPLSLAWMTIFATWFGAGTIVNQADEVRNNGLQQATLDPLGAGLCLLIVGLFYAVPLWRMRLLTLADFFRRKHGRTAEILSACIMIPSYFGWIAAQFLALAGILSMFFGMNEVTALNLVAVVGAGYTLIGGMWSVTLTDAIQVTLVLLGLILLGIVAMAKLGDGNVLTGIENVFRTKTAVVEGNVVSLHRLAPREVEAFSLWLGVLCIGMLGNVPGQDLMQRVFAAKSAAVARNACLIAGVAYLTFGAIPVLLALASHQLLPGVGESIIPALGDALLHPVPKTIFLLALLSAVLSTIDSAILSPASVLSCNLLEQSPALRRFPLLLNRVSVLLVALCSLLLARSGTGAYELLEGAYEMPLVGLFVPLTLGLCLKPRGEAPAVAAMMVGGGLWVLHYALGWELFFDWRTIPIHRAIALPLLGSVVYFVIYWRSKSIQEVSADSASR